MDRRSKRYVFIAVLAVMCLVVFFVIQGSWGHRSHIVLPPEESENEDQQEANDSELNDQISLIRITKETVQKVIAETLQRPDSYSAQLTTITYWSGGSGTTESQIYVRGGVTRADSKQPDGSVRHMLSDGEVIAIWYDQQTEYYWGNLGNISVDSELHIPSYEDISKLSQQQIREADYGEYGGQVCIFVHTEEEGYERRYYIRIEDGLLIGTETYEQGTLCHAAILGKVDTTEPAAELFLLPDGREFSQR